jgi:hypothetical protein
MVYHIQNYWVFGLLPSPGILGTRKRDVSQTASVFFLRLGVGKTPTQLGPLEGANLSHSITPLRFTQLFNHLRPGLFSGR